MKFGILFSIVAILLTFAGIRHGGWFLAWLWPAVSFAVVASGYFCFGPVVYGKSKNGRISQLCHLVLLPYHLYSWLVWYVIRLCKREPAFDQLNENIFIGRRLMGHELPPSIDHVIDLTCEFTEPKQLRSVDYHSFQILDGFVPPIGQLRSWVAHAATLNGTIYIHCAEGHGRTGLFAAALLDKLGHFNDVDDALDFIKSKRPLVRLGSRQRAVLAAIQDRPEVESDE